MEETERRKLSEGGFVENLDGLDSFLKAKERLEMCLKKIPFSDDISPKEADLLIIEAFFATMQLEGEFGKLIRFYEGRRKNGGNENGRDRA